MSGLVFQRGSDDLPAKPDNSPTFFSARKGRSTVLDLKYVHLRHFAALTKSVDHPWRYFVAAGDTLAKLEVVIAQSKTVTADLQALATEVGAESLNGAQFVFPKAEFEVVPTVVRMQYGRNKLFLSKATAPSDFFPDVLGHHEGASVKQEMLRIKGLPDTEAQAAREALARKYDAESFDGTYFHFSDWEDQLQNAPMQREKKLRHKTKPTFVRAAYDGDNFTADRETDEGFLLAQRMYEISARSSPERCFADWIASFELDLSLSGRSEMHNRPKPEAEKVGDEWIVKVPVVVEGIFGEDGKGGSRVGDKEGWVLPPGAKPIAISEYYAKLETSGGLRSLAT